MISELGVLALLRQGKRPADIADVADCSLEWVEELDAKVKAERASADRQRQAELDLEDGIEESPTPRLAPALQVHWTPTTQKPMDPEQVKSGLNRAERRRFLECRRRRLAWLRLQFINAGFEVFRSWMD